MSTFQKILIGYHGSTSAKAALEFAMGLAMDSSARLTALWVREPLPSGSDLPSEDLSAKKSNDQQFQQLYHEIREASRGQCLDVQFVSRAGNAAKTIMQYASEENFDIIVLGQSFHSWGRLLGGTVDRVVDQAECKVLIVKPD